MGVILFLLVVYGISNIIVYNSIPIYEKIFNFIMKISPKYLAQILSCMLCLPTWVGMILSFSLIMSGYKMFSPFTSAGLDIIWLAIFLDGCLASGTTWLLHTLQESLETKNGGN